jgi:peptidoglycan/xylan/chitin deacetylase (PgdA/CDA1 family)
VPDVYNYAWREYGMRVGLWRLADVFDEAGVKATVALNSQVCEVFPKAVEEMKKRGWEFMGHGTTNSTTLAGLDPEKERDTIRGILKTIEQATGKRPRGGSAPDSSKPTTPSIFSPRRAWTTAATGTTTISPIP